MNVFILNTGRYGSTTFIKACRHITNYTSAQDSRCGKLGEERFRYRPWHIEADNRLSWFLGRLDRHFGDRAFYVHLQQQRAATAAGLVGRYSAGIMHAYRRSLLVDLPGESDPWAVASDFCDTVDSNIRLFLKDKTRKMDFRLESAKGDFRRFWQLIGAAGRLQAALSEFDAAYPPARFPDPLARGSARPKPLAPAFRHPQL